MTLRSRTFLALCTGLLAGFASAQNITGVTSSNDPDVGTPPVQASIGSELTIDGSGFGSAKPKVFLTNEVGKKFNLKVTQSGDEQIKATITKAVVGDLTLNVLPKGAAEPATAAVSLEAPQIDELMDAAMLNTITSADPNVEFAISGHFFGAKKGKVKIGTKAAKVLSWADDMIHVVMPKTLPTGSFFINLDNKLAVDSDEPVGVTNSPVKLGKDAVHMTVGSDQITFKLGGALGDFDLPDISSYATAIAATTGGTTPKVLVLAVGFTDGGALPDTTVAGQGTLLGEYIDVGKVSVQNPFAVKIYMPLDGAFSVTVSSNSGGQVAGSFAGTMHGVTPNTPDISVAGDFTIDLQDVGP